MKGRIDQVQASGDVDIEIGWLGDFDDPDGDIRVRSVSATEGGLRIIREQESDA